ncbi:MAG TPA: AsmA-like C-terminal region-containing protein [Cyclobacteriaceae bacterium]|nr:AsmA-like C-terminal region-containing protein [Cyclobacteriaceae bacterium]
MKWVKGILIFIASVIFLFAVGLLLVVIYKKEILTEVSSQLKSAVHADIIIGDADITLFSEFPNFTLRLEDVQIKDPSARTGDKELLSTKTILVNVLTYKLFFKEIEFRNIKIIDGEFFIFKTRSGYSNLDVFKEGKQDSSSSAPDSSRRFRLTKEKIDFQNLRFTFNDSLRGKFIGFLLKEVQSEVFHYDSLIACTLNGSIDFQHLTFNPSRGSFLKDKSTNVSIAFNFFPDSAKLRLEPSKLSLSESEFDIRGVFDFSPNRMITLDVSSPRLAYLEGLSVIPETIANNLSQLSVERPFSIDVHLDAPMTPGQQPSVLVKFGLKDNVFKSKVVTITELSLNGEMTNHDKPDKPFDNANSVVKLDSITGKIDELPFEARAVLSNFNDLSLEIFSKHSVTLPQLNREVDSTMIHFTDGRFVSEFHYKGGLNEYFDQQTGNYTGDLEGHSTIEGGAFTLVSRKLDFKDINMNMRFNEDTVWIDKLGIKTGKSSASLSGIITNYVPYFTHPTKKGYVKLKINSPNIDMGNFLVKKKSTRARSAKQVRKDKERVSDMLDKVFTTLEFDIELKIDKMKNRTFNASNLKGKVKLNGTSLAANDISMTFGGGKLYMSMTMKDLNKEINPIEVKAKANSIAIKELFKSFDNFHQKTITDENLEGLMSFDTKFKIKINDDFDVHLPSLIGDVNMVIKNGRLINVEAIHNMSNFLFKRRDFDDVKFAQINGKVKVNHRDLEISRMEVQSTVLSLFLEGKYSLDSNTDLSIQLPLSNLKKRDKKFVPKNVGVDAKVGPSIFLVAKTNEEGKTDISYDGFRRKKN